MLMIKVAQVQALRIPDAWPAVRFQVGEEGGKLDDGNFREKADVANKARDRLLDKKWYGFCHYLICSTDMMGPILRDNS